MAREIVITIEPWQGHSSQPSPEQRTTWHLDPDNPVNVIRKDDAHCETVTAKQLLGNEKKYFICHGGVRSQIVKVTEEQDAAKAAGQE